MEDIDTLSDWGDDSSYRSDDNSDDDDDEEIMDCCDEDYEDHPINNGVMKGTMVYSNGDELTANWSLRTECFPIGEGTMKYNNGQTLTCNWDRYLSTQRPKRKRNDWPFILEDGKQNIYTSRGAGTLYLEAGGVIHSDPDYLYKLVADGKGTLISSKGDELQCTWVGGIANGPGIMKYDDRISLECEYLNGKLDGEGIMTYPNGDRVVGYWTNGVRQLHTGFISYETGRIETFKERRDGPITKTAYTKKHNEAMRELRRYKDSRKTRS